MAWDVVSPGQLNDPEAATFWDVLGRCNVDPVSLMMAEFPGAHGLHADACAYKLAGYCCSWRTRSAILYLSEGGGTDLMGGEFVFVDPHSSRPGAPPSLVDLAFRRRKVVPKCGRLVMFKSDASTVHGVLPVVRGVRHATAFWFTDVADSVVKAHAAGATERVEITDSKTQPVDKKPPPFADGYGVHEEHGARLMRSVSRAGPFSPRRYLTAVRAVPVTRLRTAQMAAALLEATGIDAEDASEPLGGLFRVMVQLYGQKVPSQALGVSAKFYEDGSSDIARYTVGLRLPCLEDDFNHGDGTLGMMMHAAAESLDAPPLVHAWADAIGDARVGVGFGLARYGQAGDGHVAGKIYVMTVPNVASMPPLPLDLDGSVLVSDAVPPPSDPGFSTWRRWSGGWGRAAWSCATTP